jgi:hypothetical protein
LLVGVDLGVGDAGVVIDGGVHEGISEAAALGAGYLASSPHSPAASGWDPSQFLDIDMEELTGPVLLIATDHTPGRRVEIP